MLKIKLRPTHLNQLPPNLEKQRDQERGICGTWRRRHALDVERVRVRVKRHRSSLLPRPQLFISGVTLQGDARNIAECVAENVAVDNQLDLARVNSQHARQRHRRLDG